MSKHLPEGQYVSTDADMTLHYIDLQPERRTSQVTIVMVHGSGPGASGWSNFKFNAQAFVEAGYRTVVFDLPGYGFSSKPTNAVYDLAYFVRHLEGLISHLAIERCVLVGNSLGGAISLGYTLAHPSSVAGLILMAPGGVEDKEVYFRTEGIQAMVKYPMGSPEFTRDVLGRLLELLVFDPSHVTDELVSERWEILQIQNPTVLATMQIPNLCERLAEIHCPVVGFWGTEDRFCPISGARHLDLACPDIVMHSLSRCGHWVMVEHADWFNRQCVDFLEHRINVVG